MSRPWKAICGASSLRSEILDAVLRIAQGLREVTHVTGPRRSPAASVDFADGSAGTATFYAYLAQASAAVPELGDVREWNDLAAEHFQNALEGISEYPMEPGLFSGLSGSAWAIAHVGDLVAKAEPGFDSGLREDQLEFLGEIEDVLVQFVEDSDAIADFDLISGLVGIGVYALEASSRPRAQRLLIAVLRQLADRAVWDEDGCAWPTTTPAARAAKNGSTTERLGLGVAHGLAGVLSFLASAVAEPAVSEDAHELLQGAGSWLLAHSLASDGYGGFPWAVLPGEEEASGATRAAWCYGDPGIASALYRAGAAREESDWTLRALNLMLDCACRDESQCKVRDACLCHGSAGLLHMFNRFAQTSDSELREAALRWLGWTLEFQEKVSGQNIAGYVALSVEEGGGEVWVAERGFLNGVAGIGLALLATINEAEPAWDRFLLLS